MYERFVGLFGYSLAKADGESRTKRTYEDMLINSSGFHNPNNISHLASTMGILSTKNTLMAGLRYLNYRVKRQAYT